MSLSVWDRKGSFTAVEREGWWMSGVKFGMTKKGWLQKSCGSCGPSRGICSEGKRKDQEKGSWRSEEEEKKRRVGVLNAASWVIARRWTNRAGGGRDGGQNRGCGRGDVSTVGTVSKAGRGRRKGEKGGGVFSGQGERTTETVSHTVPNMASADQSPSIDWPEHLTTQTNPFTSLFCRDLAGKITVD